MKDYSSTHLPIKTAVLFIVFNRPNTTSRVFEAIRKVRPPRLYVASDGPRADHNGEDRKVAKVREIATAVDWPCEVKTLFRDENFGCKYGPETGISWFFEHEEQGIILEDDCLPHPDFFSFCESLLDRYATDESVLAITGNNFQNGQQRGEASYYFSKYFHCWGWATWRRAWKHYQGDLPFWPEWSQSDDWRAKTPDPVERRYWSKIAQAVISKKVDSWAYPWLLSCIYACGLTATPNKNLVANIGFGSDSTHTGDEASPFSNMAVHSIGKLIHPKKILQDVAADRYDFDWQFGGKTMRFPYSMARTIKNFLKYSLGFFKFT